MEQKVILISIDGLRPDGLRQCGNPYVEQLEKSCAYTYRASSVDPSVTLPCHFSMTHGVSPQRHGILTNTYVPQVRPVKGIFEKIADFGGVSAFVYGWEPLRDIAQPGTLKFAEFAQVFTDDSVDTVLTDKALELIRAKKPDFAFLYMPELDDKGGHACGWMSEEYLRRVAIAIDNVKRVVEAFGEEYTILIGTDHGGHDRSHGTQMPEDMTIPFFFRGNAFTPGKELENVSLLDIVPTIAGIMGVPAEQEWEGNVLAEL